MVPPLQAYCENSPVNTLYTHIQASLVAQTIKNLPAMQETQVQLWVRKSPWEREWLPTPVFLPGESHIQRSQGRGGRGTTVCGVAKSWTRLSG